jgi:hypothetical protein
MAKKLKTYQTSLGFHDLAIAAPSMKAALEAWGAGSNLFHQGVARETDDPDVVAATMAKPGVVLKRPAGSNALFAEQSGLPDELAADAVEGKRKGKRNERRSKAKSAPTPKISELAARKAALEFEREERRREAARRRDEAARAKERARRDKAVAEAQAALDKAERQHAAAISSIEDERTALKKRADAEDDRWQKQKAKLDAALRRARG